MRVSTGQHNTCKAKVSKITAKDVSSSFRVLVGTWTLHLAWSSSRMPDD